MPIIEFIDISKSYKKDEEVLYSLNMEVNRGEIITILGESGSGKTTMLKLVNRMINFDTGELRVQGKNIKEWDKVELRRHIGYVIQQIGLFPHMTIWENISYVLMLENKKKQERLKCAYELLELVGLPKDYAYRYPRELSGGQKQRIGVARALAANPDIILMDEPFGAVDEKTRAQLQDELLKIQKALHKTILFVTHDIHEALKMGSRIALLNKGRIEQIGTGRELILNPKNEFVKNFFGIKGFTFMLDEDKLEGLYKRVLNKEIELEELLK